MDNNKTFDNMTAVADKTKVDISGSKKGGIKSEDLHNVLMTAGFSPAYGNIADAADALLYMTEGEFGEAALSGISAIPVIGQFIASKRALRAAKDAGEEFVTMYRGVDKWYQGNMVKNGKFIGGGTHTTTGYPNTVWLTNDVKYASDLAHSEKSVLLEFSVPKKWLDKNFTKTTRIKGQYTGFSMEGIPKQFLEKVTYGKDIY